MSLPEVSQGTHPCSSCETTQAPEAEDSISTLERQKRDTICMLQEQTAEGMASSKVDSKLSGLDSANDPQGFDRLMQRMKSDLMFELRHLQHGERPVTGQGHRDNLHQFMLKHCETPKDQKAAANVDAVEEHRPEAVIVEVQGMIERRPVSTVLQSAAFRRQLENVIRGGIVSASRRREPFSRTRQGLLHRQEQQIQHGTTTSPAQPAFEIRPRLSRSESNDSIDSFSSARSSADQDLDQEDDFEFVDAADAGTATQEPMNPAIVNNSPPFPRPRTNVANRGNPNLAGDNQIDRSAGVSWGDISQIHQEELVQEISELLHSRLVSTTLESEFRATLELHTQERLMASGQNGQAVQDFVRSLPGTGIPRNDFSHLGISTEGLENNNWDTVSVTSASTHSVPLVQGGVGASYLGREIQSLRAQMSEMKSMLKLTFDLQMDIQRSIRQEVAAALNNFKDQGAASASAPIPSKPVNDTHCLICLDQHSDTVLYQCGHMCVCYTCGRDLVSRGHNCPVCRAPIKDVIRAYRTNAE